MVEIPDSLRSVFSATVHKQDGAYVLDVPSGELEHGAITRGETYRIAVLDAPGTTRFVSETFDVNSCRTSTSTRNCVAIFSMDRRG